MADMQRAGMTGKASMMIPLSGNVQVGGKIMKELRFMPYSEFPETGREETLYIDTDSNVLYYYDGAYIALSGGGGGGTGNYNELSNKPQINGNVLTGNKTAANLGLQETISDLAAIRSGAASGSTAVQPATLATALATKQDVISDLESIRSGASKGDTAVQPADMEAALSEKQDTISDLQTIRSGAALGATAVQPADMETALADKQDVIADLDAIREGSTAGNTALQPGDIDTLPTNGSSNPVSSGGTYNFVNSSIATNTAYFIGTFASVAELEAYTGTVTNNDYAFVTSTDSAGNTLYNRYKYNAAIQTWSFEYAVNNTSFTTAQWAAIQSGMTASDKTKLDGIEQGATKTIIDATPTSGSSNAVSSGGVYTALSAKQDAIADLSDIRSGASAGATAVQPSALNDYQTKLSGTNKLDPSYIDYDASHRAVSDTEKSTWNGKQDTISDLATIRSGAAAGATALQQSDVSSTYSASGTAPVNGTAVNAAIGTLDVSSVGGSGKYISAISEENGKISANPTAFDTSLSSSSTNGNAPTSKTVYDDQQRQEVEIGVVANRGAKNLASKNSGSGTNSTAIPKTPITLSIGDYICSFSASSYSGNAAFELWDASNSQQYVKELTVAGSNSFKFTITGDMSVAKYSLYVNNATISDFMIRPASITDSTFQPYALPNSTLTPAVIEQIDNGAKNLVNAASGSGVRFINIPIVLQPGDYYVLFQNITSTDTDASTCQFGAFANDDSQASNYPQLKRGNNTEAMFTVTKQTAYVRLYAANNFASGAGDTVTFTGCMICTAADWAVSQKFVPYAPTNRELYETKAEKTEIHDLLANITSSSTLTAYTDSLASGHYTSFIANTNRPTDVPVFDNMFIEIYVYSVNTALIRAFPTGTVYVNQFFQKSKVAGVWRDWYKFEGTAVT